MQSQPPNDPAPGNFGFAAPQGMGSLQLIDIVGSFRIPSSSGDFVWLVA
jgi:hypothetical protein